MEDLGKIFFAQFESDCASCGDRIYEDDEARYLEGEVIGQACCGQDLEAQNEEAKSKWDSIS